mgnify:CR=1 FL=1
MSMARKCDRCGKFYEKNRVKWNCEGSITRGIDVVNINNLIAVEYDLCDSCIEDLRCFMSYDDKEVNENGEEGTE